MTTAHKPLTIADLRRAAAQYGGTVDGGIIGRYASYNVDAPDGKVWACEFFHALHLDWHVGDGGRPTWPAEKQDALADAIERMGMGLEDCDDPECDSCHPGE